MKDIQKDITDMLECELVKDNEDGTKQYMVKSNAEIDLRKQLFDILPKKDVTIFELKKAERSLEDAFLTLVDTSTKEIKEKQEKEAEEKQKQQEEKKKAKEAKKDKKIKENKKEKKEKEENKEEKKTPKKTNNKKQKGGNK